MFCSAHIFHVPSIYCSHSKRPREQEALIHFHGETTVDGFYDLKVLKVRILDQFIFHCGWCRLNFTLGNEHEGESWAVMYRQIFLISADKNPGSAELN
jgi:hypothetical protein